MAGNDGSGMAEMESAVAVEFHPNPTPHFVMDRDSWERLMKAHVNEGSRISGVHGTWHGDPVYLDRCPCATA